MIMPGSHLSGRHPTAEEGANSGIHLGAIPLEGKAGTLVIYDARLWHQAGLNRGTQIDPILREPWRLCISQIRRDIFFQDAFRKMSATR